MPTYEYLCKTCSHRFETWQKMTAEPLTVCPECGGAIRRVLFPAGVVFKGSGFYKTDNASSNHSDAQSSTSKSETESTSTSKSSESKPAASSSSESKPAPAATTTK